MKLNQIIRTKFQTTEQKAFDSPSRKSDEKEKTEKN